MLKRSNPSMPEARVIRVFEYERLRVGDSGFEERHWEALGKWAERQTETYVEIWPGSVRFLHWVGVFEVDGLVIEILPKAEESREEENRAEQASKWRNILLRLLREAGYLDVRTVEEAGLGLQNKTLIDVLFSQFLDACELLFRRGLVRRYRPVARRRTAVKGRIDFQSNLRRGPGHAELIDTVALEYDRVNLLNLILKAAIEASALYAPSQFSRGRARRFAIDFQEWPSRPIRSSDFNAVRFDRKTEAYKRAIPLARLILDKKNPDLAMGTKRVFSLLFDMNDLWEKAIFARLRHEARCRNDLHLRAQRSKVFWRSGSGSIKTVRPDILVERDDGIRVVLDTKWKVLSAPVPSDGDLKQIFVYDTLWKSERGFLVYPKTGTSVLALGRYCVPDSDRELSCGLATTEVDPAKWSAESLLSIVGMSECDI